MQNALTKKLIFNALKKQFINHPIKFKVQCRIYATCCNKKFEIPHTFLILNFKQPEMIVYKNHSHIHLCHKSLQLYIL